MARTCRSALDVYTANPGLRDHVDTWMLRFARTVESSKQWATVERVDRWFDDHAAFRGSPGFYSEPAGTGERLAWDLLGGFAGQTWARETLASGPDPDVELAHEDGDGELTADLGVFSDAFVKFVEDHNRFDTDGGGEPPVPMSPIEYKFRESSDDRALEWDGLAVLEGSMTSDMRFIAPGALTWRRLPFPLLQQLETQRGHDGAVPVGPVTFAERVTAADISGRVPELTADLDGDAGGIWLGGVFDTGEHGSNARRAISEGTLTGVSADLTEVEIRQPETEEEAIAMMAGELPLVITSARLAGATLVSIPAFEDARLQIHAPAEPDVDALVASGGQMVGVWRVTMPLHRINLSGRTVVNSPAVRFTMPLVASGGPRPDREWFEPFDYTEPSPVTLEKHDGSGLFMLHGHLGLRGSCHIGFAGRCRDIPVGLDYDSFQGDRAAGMVTCSDGTKIHAGPVLMDTNHADVVDASGRPVPAGVAVDHYAHTGALVAQGRIYEDRYGPYVRGWVLPGVSDRQLAVLDAADLSPDWRPRATARGGQGVVALLVVGVSGFNTALVASGLTVDEFAELPDAHQADVLASGLTIDAEWVARARAVCDELGFASTPLLERYEALTVDPDSARRVEVLAALRDAVSGSCGCGAACCAVDQ